MHRAGGKLRRRRVWDILIHVSPLATPVEEPTDVFSRVVRHPRLCSMRQGPE